MFLLAMLVMRLFSLIIMCLRGGDDGKQNVCLAPRSSHAVGEKVNNVRVILWKVVTVITALFLVQGMSDFFTGPLSSG